MDFLQKNLGRVSKGSVVIVVLDKRANVLLMDQPNFNRYKKNQRHSYYGGQITRSPARIPVPRTGHWFVAIDLGGLAGKVSASVSVEPPSRGALPTYREPGAGSIDDEVGLRPKPQIPGDPEILGGRSWDVFLSHASEEKAEVAIPLAQELQDRGVSVWLDQAELRIGDSLRQHIDQGIASSRFSAVIFSEAYFTKGWPQYELDGIVNLTVDGKQAILPIWHGMDKDAVARHSPSLANKFARSTSEFNVGEIADEIAAVVRTP